MSGGHFDYNQYKIREIKDSIEQFIVDNDYNFLNSVLDEFKKGVKILAKAEIYVQRIDWLLSGDDGEETFLKRLREDLKEMEKEFNDY